MKIYTADNCKECEKLKPFIPSNAEIINTSTDEGLSEALYAGVTGLNWIQVSAGTSQGPTGYQGITGVQGAQGITGVQGSTGLANFLDRTDFPVVAAEPLWLWNRVDEALYAGITGIGHWVQISAGALQGATGATPSGDTTDVFLPTDNVTLSFVNGLLTGVS